MSYFESVIALLAVAVLLLQVTRRMQLPYPGILAATGCAVAALPSAPNIPIDPHTALALFIAPILIDSAYDFPLRAAWRLMVPLIVFAVGAVVLTTAVVVAIGSAGFGLPLVVAVTLGAIVSPPDAAATTAVLVNLPVARRVDALLKGESLFNDATTLLLFSGALAIQAHGGIDGATALRLGLAVPGGIAFGVGYGLLVSRVRPLADNSVGGTLLQFVHAFATWLIAERLHLSPVLATVASAMTIATHASVRDSPRMRVHSFAVWTTVVFLLNVLAFLLMGMQARSIVGAMSAPQLSRALGFAGAVVVAVIATRLALAFLYRVVAVWRCKHTGGPEPVSRSETFLIGWAGMRGLVTLATAFALPGNFPERNLVVLTAFAVVLATLVLQGGTLALLIRWLKLERHEDANRERDAAQLSLVEAALARLEGEEGDTAEEIRTIYREHQNRLNDRAHEAPLAHRRGLALAAVLAQRKRLDELRDADAIGPDQYLELQEDLDWRQLGVTADEDRRLNES